MVLDNVVWLLLVLFYLFNAAFTPNFTKMQNMVNILYQTTSISLLVLGQGIVMMVGELDLSIDSTLAFAPGVAVIVAAAGGEMNPALAIALTLLVGAGVGLLNGVFVAKVKANSFLFTLSTEIAMRGLVLFLIPFSIAGLHPAFSYLGRGKLGMVPVAVIAVLVIYAIFEFVFRKTVFGRKFLLTGGNRQAAFISGIDTDKVMIWSFVIAGVLAAVAGLVTAGRQNAVSNVMGKDMVMMAFAAAILGGCSFNGGLGKPIGMLGGALLLGMIDNSLNLLGVNVNLVSATKGALIFIAIVLDRVKTQLTAQILYRENVFKLKAGGGDGET
jgi:simple sugar transport system permease protein/ribose transport system permease protein